MDRLNRLLTRAMRALATLDDALAIEEPVPIERDGTIQRFEYTFETVIRLCRQYLTEIEGASERNPKPIMRKLALAAIVSDDEARKGIRMADDRNLTDHTYSEAVADRVYRTLPEHARLLRAVVERLAERIAQRPSS